MPSHPLAGIWTTGQYCSVKKKKVNQTNYLSEKFFQCCSFLEGVLCFSIKYMKERHRNELKMCLRQRKINTYQMSNMSKICSVKPQLKCNNFYRIF